ncbi:MAG: FAD-binding oxidoreductase [Ornithinimicrobium sp.]
MTTAKSFASPSATSPSRPSDCDGDHSELKSFARSATCTASLRRPDDDAAWERLFARSGPRGVTVRGCGASYSDAALNEGGTVALSTAAPQILAWDTERGVVDVDAGLTLGQLLTFCVPLGWTLPVLPGTARVTVGGAVAADVHGKNHPRAGSFSSCVTQLALITPGQGTMTVSPAERPEVFWATVGGVGLTGVVRRVRLQLQRISSSWLSTTDTVCADVDEVLSVMTEQGTKHEHVVGWIDGYAPVGSLGRGIVSTGDHCTVDHLPARLRRRAHRYEPHHLTLGISARANLVRPATIRAANTARYYRARGRTGRSIRDFTHAFHPLDAVTDWPVVYGREGLVQYQFCVPDGHENLLQRALEYLPAAGCPPALVTLKRLGAASPAPLSFPSPGWTMALDVATRPARGASSTFDHLDESVTRAGGRIYLVKNSRTRPELIARMYPNLQHWQSVREALDPQGVMTSDLDRRLNLTGWCRSGGRSW